MKSTVEFQSNSSSAPSPLAPTGYGSKKTWQDNTYKPEYQGLTLRIDQKITWLRVLPPIKGSQHNWIHPFNQFVDGEGRYTAFTDPQTFGQESLFAKAQQWFRKNKPECLYVADTNPRGFKLYSKKMGSAWVINSAAPEGSRLRILSKSMYDGIKGGSQGLGFQLWSLANQVDNEPGSATLGQPIYGDVSDPQNGRLLKIEKSGEKQLTSYTAGIGKSIVPLNMDELTDAEVDLIKPLETLLHVPTMDEQKAALLAYIGKDFYDAILG